jgi:predicted nucleic acid-binding protein
VIFLDTGFVFALISPKDEHHERALRVFEALKTNGTAERLLTTNHVVAETITLVRRIGHEEATRVGDRLYSGDLARIYWATPDDERTAFAWFKRHRDQTYSFVDCLSFVVMEKLGIREALTMDSDFTHRFVARPGPKRSS